MFWLSWLFSSFWSYRMEILFAVQALSKLRQSAADMTRDYIRKRVRERMWAQVGLALVETGLIVSAYYWNRVFPSLTARLVASVILWTITLYNGLHLVFSTIPELAAVYRALRGKVGFTLRYILRISLVTELMELDVVFLAVCLVLAVSSRTMVGHTFGYVRPWKELSVAIAKAPHRPHRHRRWR